MKKEAGGGGGAKADAPPQDGGSNATPSNGFKREQQSNKKNTGKSKKQSISKKKGWNFDTEIVTHEQKDDVQEFGIEEQPDTKISWLSSSEPKNQPVLEPKIAWASAVGDTEKDKSE